MLRTPPAPPTRASGAGRSHPMAKGQQTRANIIDTALHIATHHGLQSLSIGGLAEATSMSKSGVFAHFGSREELQICVVREYHHRFEQEVFYPAIQAPKGLPRLRAMFGNWMQRTTIELDSGCIYISGAVEFGGREGAVRDALIASFNTWHTALCRAIEQAQALGHLNAQADPRQLLFEIHGLILALHYEVRFLGRNDSVPCALAGFENILRRNGAKVD